MVDQKVVMEDENLDDSRLQKLIDDVRREISYVVTDYPVELIYDKFTKSGDSDEPEIFVPSYQRSLVWNNEQISYFIESLILRVPVPPIFLYDVEGRLEIVDGSQRVRAIARFLNGEVRLRGLLKLNFLNDLLFRQLPPVTARRLRNTPVRTFVLSETADQSTRADLFRRLNTSGKKLEDAEIRIGAFPGPLMDLVKDCALNVRFQEICPAKRGQRGVESERQELVLRFFSYYSKYEQFDHDVARFLDRFLLDGNADFSAHEIANLRDTFLRMVGFAYEHLPYGFRRAANSYQTPRVRFEALSVGIARALDSGRPLNTQRISEWLDSNEFRNLVAGSATNSGPRLRARIEFVRDALLYGR